MSSSSGSPAVSSTSAISPDDARVSFTLSGSTSVTCNATLPSGAIVAAITFNTSVSTATYTTFDTAGNVLNSNVSFSKPSYVPGSFTIVISKSTLSLYSSSGKSCGSISMPSLASVQSLVFTSNGSQIIISSSGRQSTYALRRILIILACVFVAVGGPTAALAMYYHNKRKRDAKNRVHPIQ